METVKLSKRIGIHEAGEEIEANDTLLKHLKAGGYITEPEQVKAPKKTAKKTEK